MGMQAGRHAHIVNFELKHQGRNGLLLVHENMSQAYSPTFARVSLSNACPHNVAPPPPQTVIQRTDGQC